MSTAVDLASARDFIAAEEAQLAAVRTVLPFEDAEYAERRERLRAGMADAGLDALILTSPDAMCWLTGYQSRWYRAGASTSFPPCQCIVLPATKAGPWMVETGFHTQMVRIGSNVDDIRLVPGSGMTHEPSVNEFTGWLVQNLHDEGLLGGTLGVERWSILPTPAVAIALTAALEQAGAQVCEADVVVRAARRSKSPAELAMIERAAHACDSGLRALQEQMRPGMTGLQAWQLYMQGVIAAGGEPSAIHETVFAGPAEPLAHLLSSHAPIRRDEYFCADASAAFERYHVRGTRPFSFGAPPRELLDLTAIAAGAYDVLRSVGRAGITFGELNRALYDYFTDAGLGPDEFFAGGYELGISFPPEFVGELTWSAHDRDSEVVIPAGLVTNMESIAFATLVETVVFESDGARTLSRLPAAFLEVNV